MKIYGLTVVRSIAKDLHGNSEDRKICTELFTSKEAAINYAVEKATMWFEPKSGKDQNGNTLEDLIKAIREGKDITIQASVWHVEMSLFVQNMPNIINRDDYIATKMWTEEDVKQSLIEKGFAGTEDQVADVINTGCLRALVDCNDDDWAILDNAITSIEEDLINGNPDILATGIEWDVDRDEFESEAEYEAVLENVLPEKEKIPFSELYGSNDAESLTDAVVDYLSDKYGYCIKCIKPVEYDVKEA